LVRTLQRIDLKTAQIFNRNDTQPQSGRAPFVHPGGWPRSTSRKL